MVNNRMIIGKGRTERISRDERNQNKGDKKISQNLNKIRDKGYRRFRRTRSWFGGEGRNGT